MKKALTLLALLSTSAYAAPYCPSGSYEIGPYLGIEGSVAKLHTEKTKGHSRIKPQVILGARVHPDWAIEATIPLSAHKHKLKDVTSTQALGKVQITNVYKLPPILTHKIDLRAVFSSPIQGDCNVLLGLGVSHLKLKQKLNGQPSINNAKLAPSALVGLQFNATSPLSARISATYTPAIKHKLGAIKARQHLGVQAGFVYNF